MTREEFEHMLNDIEYLVVSADHKFRGDDDIGASSDAAVVRNRREKLLAEFDRVATRNAKLQVAIGQAINWLEAAPIEYTDNSKDWDAGHKKLVEKLMQIEGIFGINE